jgi:hypothetical protein
MKPSEQPPHPGRNHIREPLQDMPIPAQIFANYVFVPARRRPDGNTWPGGLHGSALLVFGDKVSEKVELRTGYASRVTRHALLDARKDRSDKIVSGHAEISWKAFLVFTFWYFVIGAAALGLYAMLHY